MSSIVEFLAGDLAFDPPAIDAMAQALEAVCEALHINGNASAREVVAIRIIELSRRGERSPVALRDVVLAEARRASRC